MIFKIFISFFMLTNVVVSKTNLLENPSNVANSINENLINNFNGDFTKIINYNDLLFTYNKRDKSFTFSISLINKMIEKYGEDSIYTKISYLFLASHYTAYNDIESAKELLFFVSETKENQVYENAPHLNQLLLLLKADVYEKMRFYANAYILYKKSLVLTRKTKDDNNLSEINILNSIVRVSLSMKKVNKTLSYLMKAVELENKLPKKEGKDEKIDSVMLLAKVYEYNNDYTSAIDTLKDEIDLHLKRKDMLFPKMIELLTLYSSFALKLDAYIPASTTSHMSLNIQKKLNIKNSIYEIYNYFFIGYSEKKIHLYKQSRESLKKSLKLLNKATMRKKEKLDFSQQINTLLSDINNTKNN